MHLGIHLAQLRLLYLDFALQTSRAPSRPFLLADPSDSGFRPSSVLAFLTPQRRLPAPVRLFQLEAHPFILLGERRLRRGDDMILQKRRS